MRHPFRIISLTFSVFVLGGLVACVAPPMNSQPMSSYPAQTYPAQGYYIEYARVTNIETFQTQEQASGSGLGAVIGGVAGAVVGHQIGSGTGRDVATVAGAVGGAVAGNAIEKNRNPNVRQSYRISVQLDNGGMRAYDVPSYGDLRIGDRVRIENGQLYRL